MHFASCPSCGLRVDLDFKPVSGLVWCPTCQKLFNLPFDQAPNTNSELTDESVNGERN